MDGFPVALSASWLARWGSWLRQLQCSFMLNKSVRVRLIVLCSTAGRFHYCPSFQLYQRSPGCDDRIQPFSEARTCHVCGRVRCCSCRGQKLPPPLRVSHLVNVVPPLLFRNLWQRLAHLEQCCTCCGIFEALQEESV